MKKMLFLSLFALAAITACKKDSLGTKPVITFKSYSYAPVDASLGLDVTFQVKDGDGDIENALQFTAIYDRNPTDTNFSGRPMPGLDASKRPNLSAEVVLHLGTIDFPNDPDNPVAKDSVHFLVYVVDNANNISDTIATPKVEILYPGS
ncbi:hypothetical protein SAMN05518672_104215 [Chitinophaga sp. CF118]|uniref:hypothetical protein n=1 Tax=Chitinophaga sp. CF118 TaxID=1884367 RepID=UPI0008E94D5A|nr:hypothetical protein [Chitinophaga sp. CF118]SFE03528.1 hypothetical protein SAMN05518672_104215 [Chitinophaga sp. CF118]